MLSPKTESANLRTILDPTQLHMSRYPSLCSHIYSVPSVAKVSRIPKSATPAPTKRTVIGN